MKELSTLGYCAHMAAMMLKNAKTTNTPMGVAKSKLAFEKQFYLACKEWDEYYHEHYEDILWEVK